MNWKLIKALTAAGVLTISLAATAVSQTAPPAQDSNQATQPGGANPTTSAEPNKQPGLGPALEKLNLSDDQKTQIMNIRQKTAEQVQALKSDTSLTDQQKRDKFRSIRMDTHKQISAVLTPDQRKQWQQMQQQHRAQMQAEHQQKSPSTESNNQ